MKRTLTAVISVFFLLPLLTGCPWDRPDYRALAERLGALDGGDETPVKEDRVEELKRDIKRVDKEIDDTIAKVRDKGTYYKLLGLKYMDYSMWNEGVDAFSGALEVYPENSRLHYYRGVCLAQAGVNESRFAEKNALFRSAEEDYIRASEIDRIYGSPLWGLAILYVYEMDRPSDAAPVLDRLLDIQPSHEKATLLRAELYRAAGDKMRALELYHKLQADGKDKQSKAEALHRAAALGG